MAAHEDQEDKNSEEHTSEESDFIPLIVRHSSPPAKNHSLLRDWWHHVLRNYGRYSCYSILLVLPSDKEMIRYFTEYGRELNLISSKDCLILVFSEAEYMQVNLDENSLSNMISEHVSEGYSVRVARMFNVSIVDFPSLLLFKDIRSPEHYLVKFKDLTAEQISVKLREIFAVIQAANNSHKNPFKAIEQQRKRDKLSKAGHSIISELGSFSGKTFELAIQALIDERVK
jgi:hypothetical protein